MVGYANKPGAGALTSAQPGAPLGPSDPGKRTLVQQLEPSLSPSSTSQAARGPAVAGGAGVIAAPQLGINKTAFVDNSKGAPVYTRASETGGVQIGDAVLPPACRVFVSGSDRQRANWLYVTAYIDGSMVRGYVESFRINSDLPEPLAELRQLKGKETAEGLAREKFGHAVRDGHDLRYYENVMLYVNQGRKGIQGTYQDPGLIRRGDNNIKLYAPHRIWLVSAEYAKTLEGIVPSGSLTGGAVAKARRFAAHFEDILHSVTESPQHFEAVAGEVAQAIRDNLGPIIGITAGFLVAEAGSMFLAAVPSGVSQAAAAIIQLALSAFGAAGMVTAGVEALKHGTAWLTTAWTAHGRADVVAEASREFVRMLVAIAIAALNRAGAKGNYRNALKIANQMPTGGLPALATVGAQSAAGGGVQAGAAIVAGPGGIGFPAAVALRLSDREKDALGEGPDVDDLHDKSRKEARAGELHDRRAAEGRRAPEAAPNAEPLPPANRPRTNDAQHVPPPGEAFIDWFDSLTSEELDRLLADKGTKTEIGAREIIHDNIRHPGGQHEWLMVAEARRFKQWGVSLREVLQGRTATLATIGKRFRHAGKTGSIMHRELRAMIKSSNSFHEFLLKLNDWSDVELVPSHSPRWPEDPAMGRYSLPENLQIRGHK